MAIIAIFLYRISLKNPLRVRCRSCENDGVDASFQQKFKCHSSKISCARFLRACGDCPVASIRLFELFNIPRVTPTHGVRSVKPAPSPGSPWTQDNSCHWYYIMKGSRASIERCSNGHRCWGGAHIYIYVYINAFLRACVQLPVTGVMRISI